MSKSPQPLYAANPELKVVTGKFNTISGTASITTVGQGFTVAKASTGTYTITFDNPQHTLVSFSAQLQTAAVNDFVVGVGPYTAATATAAATQTVYTIDDDATAGRAAADPADNANSNLHFTAYLAMYTTMV